MKSSPLHDEMTASDPVPVRYRYAPIEIVRSLQILKYSLITMPVVLPFIILGALLVVMQPARSATDPTTFLIGLCALIFVIVPITAYFGYWSNVKKITRKFNEAAFTVESGFLVFRAVDVLEAYSMSIKVPYSRQMDLATVVDARLGNMQHTDGLRILLTDHKGKQMAIPTLEHMDDFIAVVERHLPVPLDRVNEDLPRRTRAEWVKQGLMIGGILAAAAGTYLLLQWWNGV